MILSSVMLDIGIPEKWPRKNSIFVRSSSKERLCSFSVSQRKGINNVKDIVSKWAPSNENDTAAYIRHVVKSTKFSENEKLNLNDPAVLAKLISARRLRKRQDDLPVLQKAQKLVDEIGQIPFEFIGGGKLGIQ